MARPQEVEMSHYSAGQAIDSLGFGRFQIYLSVMVGFAYMADAMEMMILSILGPALHCEWHITEYQQATLTTVVFLGMLLSSSIWGILADKYGRRTILVVSISFLFYFGVLSAAAPSFGWMLFLRCLVGFYIGGGPQVITLYAEYLPTMARGKAILVMSFFWAIGATFEAVLALLTMGPHMGWRYLVAISSLPLLVFLLFSRFLPESLMFLAVTGQKDLVERQLNTVARLNEKPAVHGNLVLDEETASSASRGRVADLFKGPVGHEAKLTTMVLFLWFVAANMYYGVVLISTELLNSSTDTCGSGGGSSGAMTSGDYDEEVECSLHKCSGLKTDDYVQLVWTTFAEFPGTVLALLLIDRVGRKRTLALQAAIFALATLCLVGCGGNGSRWFIVLVLFTARGAAAGFFQTVYVYTPEVYPTKLRALAMGTHSGCARFGAMLTPYVAQVLLKSSLYAAVAVYVLLGVLAAVIAMFLPVESLGQSLDDATAAHAQPKGIVDQMEQNELEGKKEEEERRPTERY